MSRHIPRTDRWTAHGPSEYRSIDGLTVRFFKGAWWADVPYRISVVDEEGRSSFESHEDRLGPFRRPRNAMVEAERHLTMLQNRHAENFTRANPI
jgi:hypothetical protein